MEGLAEIPKIKTPCFSRVLRHEKEKIKGKNNQRHFFLFLKSPPYSSFTRDGIFLSHRDFFVYWDKKN